MLTIDKLSRETSSSFFLHRSTTGQSTDGVDSKINCRPAGSNLAIRTHIYRSSLNAASAVDATDKRLEYTFPSPKFAVHKENSSAKMTRNNEK